MSEQRPIKLTLAALRQLESYADDRDDVGWYYGNRTQFERRHEVIRAWLQQEIEKQQPKSLLEDDLKDSIQLVRMEKR